MDFALVYRVDNGGGIEAGRRRKEIEDKPSRLFAVEPAPTDVKKQNAVQMVRKQTSPARGWSCVLTEAFSLALEGRVAFVAARVI